MPIAFCWTSYGTTSDTSQGHDDNDDIDAVPLPDISITLRGSTDSVTIDILDLLFLVFLDDPIERAHSGLQLCFPYTTRNDKKKMGSLSLTFYPTASCLLIQETSCLIRVEEHMPVIYREAETRYLADIDL